jgi:ADP-ribose pyrophosphatase YjhB (NUDIX family)
MAANSRQDLSTLIRTLETSIADPRVGLPEEVFLFISRLTPMVNVDLLVRERGRVLLTWRDDPLEPAPGWHVPGGIIRFKETAADRIRAVASLELGAGVRWDPIPLAVREVIERERKDRGHFISVLYRCELTGDLDPHRRFSGGHPAPGQWAWHSRCPDDLIAVHDGYRRYIDGAEPPFAWIDG